jgi:hypothetical protein
MGLDLSVVKNLKYIGDESDFSEEEMDDLWDNKVHLYNNDMLFRQSDGLKTGFYDGDYVSGIDRVGWSYSGYNAWRSVLAKFIGYNDVNDIGEKYQWIVRDDVIASVLDEKIEREREPFIEMCYFSDCEGFIGPKTSARLYKDFLDNTVKYFKYLDDENVPDSIKEYYKNCYTNLIEYFRIASEENGAVLFH